MHQLRVARCAPSSPRLIPGAFCILWQRHSDCARQRPAPCCSGLACFQIRIRISLFPFGTKSCVGHCGALLQSTRSLPSKFVPFGTKSCERRCGLGWVHRAVDLHCVSRHPVATVNCLACFLTELRGSDFPNHTPIGRTRRAPQNPPQSPPSNFCSIWNKFLRGALGGGLRAAI